MEVSFVWSSRAERADFVPMSTQQNLFLHSLASQVKEFAKIKSGDSLRLKVRDAFGTLKYIDL